MANRSIDTWAAPPGMRRASAASDSGGATVRSYTALPPGRALPLGPRPPIGEDGDVSVILLTGIQAAGKSTVAQALAESIPESVHVRGDLFRRMIVNGRVEMGPAVPDPRALEQLRLRYELAAATADRYAQAGFTVVLQDIILGDALREMVERITSRPLSVVVLAPSAAAVAARDAERAARRGKIAYKPGDEGIAALDRALRYATPRLGYWLDTSALSVAQTVADIRANLDGAARIP